MMTTRLCFYSYWFTADEHKSNLKIDVCAIGFDNTHTSLKLSCESGLLDRAQLLYSTSEVKFYSVFFAELCVWAQL